IAPSIRKEVIMRTRFATTTRFCKLKTPTNEERLTSDYCGNSLYINDLPSKLQHCKVYTSMLSPVKKIKDLLLKRHS
ncbi:hypothetical protein DOY81_006701, partial [Sarcophaga bullata]